MYCNACSYRAKHNAPALSWDPKLAAVAQSWADSCPAGLSDHPYGENMAWGYKSFIDAAEAWYSEVSTLLLMTLYDYLHVSDFRGFVNAVACRVCATLCAAHTACAYHTNWLRVMSLATCKHNI